MFKRTAARWAAMPWLKTLKATAWFIVGFTLLLGVPGAGLNYTDFPTFAENVGVFLVMSGMLGLYGAFMFFVFWMTSDVPQGWENFKRFWREFPENWRNFWRTVGAVLYWVLMLPFTIGRGLIRIGGWLKSAPARWRAVPRKEKRAMAVMCVMFAVLGGIARMYWPLASHWAGGLPHWVFDGDVLVPTMLIDMMLSAFTLIFGVTLLGFAFDLAKLAFRRRGSQ